MANLYTSVLWDYYGSSMDSFSEAAGNVQAKMGDILPDDYFLFWVMPKEFKRHYAYNPITCKAYLCKLVTANPGKSQQGTFVYDSQQYWYYVDEDATPIEVELSAYSDTAMQNVVATLKADTMKGCAVFNIAPAVRGLLAEYPVADGQPMSANDTSVMRKVYIENLRVKTTHPNAYLTYYLMNAVAQTGSDGQKDMEDNKMYLLQDQRTLFIPTKAYLGYTNSLHASLPEITVVCNRTFTTPLYLWTGLTTSVNFVAGNVYRILMGGETIENGCPNVAAINVMIDMGYFDPLSDQRKFKVQYIDCELSRVFPIRWRNRRGVFDYYTFVGTAYKIKDGKTTGVKDRYIEDGSKVNTNRIPYAVEGSRKIKLGIDNATTEEIDVLTRLPYAPWIEWYDYANEMWTRVTVADFKNEEDMASPSNYYEITLECPAINMQF